MKNLFLSAVAASSIQICACPLLWAELDMTRMVLEPVSHCLLPPSGGPVFLYMLRVHVTD